MNFLEGRDVPSLFPDALPGVSWLMLSPPNLLGKFCFLVQAVFVWTRRAHGPPLFPRGYLESCVAFVNIWSLLGPSL